jgi:hypothetical protein
LQKRKSCKKEKVVGVTLKFPTLQRSVSDSDYVVLIPLPFLSLLTTLLLTALVGRQAGRQAGRHLEWKKFISPPLFLLFVPRWEQ